MEVGSLPTGGTIYLKFIMSGCGVAWFAWVPWKDAVAGSNPASLT